MGRTDTRNFYFLLLVVFFLCISFFLYGSIDNSTNERLLEAQISEQDLEKLRNRVFSLEHELNKNERTMEEVKRELEKSEAERKILLNKQNEQEKEVYDAKEQADKVLEFRVDQDHEEPGDGPGEELKNIAFQGGNKVAVVHNVLSKVLPKVIPNVCSLRSNFSGADAQIQMLDIYNIIPFDNEDGGVWKQGWEITYKEADVKNAPKLEVVVVPHSHCDPGWLKTFEQYFETETRNILDGMAKHLELKPDMRFIYAEMSFFEMWWAEQTNIVREKVKSWLKSGQLEIVTGGWVMTDEANSHYYSIITEMMEGHEFIRNHIGDFIPRSHWSIDPFGLSPSLPLILSAANITNAAFQRVHYSVKKKLAQGKNLEFMWRQLWGGYNKNHDVRAHMFPFYSYDVPHSCGPEPRVCCQFDFKRLPAGGKECDWGEPPQEITNKNVESRAFMIYDQYRKKSQLYKTNVLLVPLGDDFRFQDDFEWNKQHDNFKKLFEYMNTKEDWNVHARFGTLSDYFDLLDKALKDSNEELPVLSGDFFTYADRDDHYWSGYFTSRPFYKQMDRVLQHSLRSAEIIYSLAKIQQKQLPDSLFSFLVEARRALSLFQHHDGVTGTARSHVVIDYGEKMLSALNGCNQVISSALGSLMNRDHSPNMKRDEHQKSQDSLPVMISAQEGGSVVIFNSLAQSRSEVACIRVTSPTVRVKTANGERPLQQLGPVVEVVDGHLKAIAEQYELCFVADVGPFSSLTFHIDADSSADSEIVKVKGPHSVPTLPDSFIFEQSSIDFHLMNEFYTAYFDGASAMLKFVTPSLGSKIEINMQFVKYGARKHRTVPNGGGDDLSGAYLFLPDGDAQILKQKNSEYVVIDGLVVKKVIVMGPSDGKIQQTYTVAKGEHYVGVSNRIDLRERNDNIEIAMRLSTNVVSGDDVFTDLNGMQMIRRRRMLNKLPLQAHFYPMPASAFIEDESTRVSLLGAQALGVASLKSGWLEVMLDRRTLQDDGRGMGQPMIDNKVSVSNFRLLVEPLSAEGSKPSIDKKATIGFHSTLAQQISLQLHYPWVKLLADDRELAPSFSGLSRSLPCDTHVVTLRTMAGPTEYEKKTPTLSLNEAALVLYRTLPDCRSKLTHKGECNEASEQMSIKSLLNVKSVSNVSLTLLYDYGTPLDNVSVDPQDIRTVKITF